MGHIAPSIEADPCLVPDVTAVFAVVGVAAVVVGGGAGAFAASVPSAESVVAVAGGLAYHRSVE